MLLAQAALPSATLRLHSGQVSAVATTGLLYVDEGQYYDPSTGRFLTRNAKPNQTNPYLPFDPSGAMLGHIRNFNEHPAGRNFICIMLNCPLGMA
jgi:hypothetical protein